MFHLQSLKFFHNIHNPHYTVFNFNRLVLFPFCIPLLSSVVATVITYKCLIKSEISDQIQIGQRKKNLIIFNLLLLRLNHFSFVSIWQFLSQITITAIGDMTPLPSSRNQPFFYHVFISVEFLRVKFVFHHEKSKKSRSIFSLSSSSRCFVIAQCEWSWERMEIRSSQRGS